MKRRYRAAFWSAAVVLGFLQIWGRRTTVNPDGVMYMEMAWTTVRIGLFGLVNGHWSPLYPALLSLVFLIFHPGPSLESTTVQLSNLAIYLAALACFELFLRELLLLRAACPAPGDDRVRFPDKVLWIWGYVFFLWASCVWLTPALITPDVCIAALAYLLTAILLRIRRGAGGWAVYVGLGALLGAAYLAKAFMFLVGWIFLASSLAAAKSIRRAFPRAALAAALFLLIAAPQILALHRLTGRWTFSDSGALNYAWFIDRIPQMYWQGGPAQAGVPLHPPRPLLAHPAAYEFPVDAAGVFHPSYDRAYWYDGVRPYFEWRGQLRVLADSFGFYVQMFSRTGALYAAFLVLFLLLRRSGSWGIRAALREWPVWLPSYAALALFALVLVEARYVGGFVLMLLVGWFAFLEPAPEGIVRRLPLVTWAPVLLAVAAILWFAAGDVLAIAHPKPAPQFQIAGALESTDVLPGGATNLAAAGAAPRAYAATVGDVGTYWAHLAGTRVVAAVPSAQEFWQSDAATQSQIMSRLSSAGVQIMLDRVPRPSAAMSGPANGELNGWQRLAGTDVYILRLQPSPAPHPSDR